MDNDWSQFTLSSFLHRTFAAPGPKEDNSHDKARLKRSQDLLEAGEISRAYKALQSENHPTPEAAEVFTKLTNLHPARPETSIIPDKPADLPDITLGTAEVFDTLSLRPRTGLPIAQSRQEDSSSTRP